MKTAAVIAEWNPFHNGHAYFLDEVRRRSGADYILAVMSGDFVQRGAPAVVDKYARTKMALDGGADLVIELPVATATGSAGEFAAGAVSVLERTGVVEELWFGSECGEIGPFLELSEILAEEPESFRKHLQEATARGLSFPAARAMAAAEELKARRPEVPGNQTPESSAGLPYDPAQFLSQPNNILGLAYCIELKKRGSSIRAHTIRREGAGYHTDDTSDRFCYPSAEGIRQLVLRTGRAADGMNPAGTKEAGYGNLKRQLERMMPQEAASDLAAAAAQNRLPAMDDFSDMLFYRLLQERPESMQRYYGMTVPLANRILTQAAQCRTASALAEAVKAKHLTRAGIDRMLLRILLGIDREAVRRSCESPVLRILGFRNCDALLHAMHRAAAGPYEMRVSAIPEEAYRTDLFASHLYEWVCAGKSGGQFTGEYHRMVIK